MDKETPSNYWGEKISKEFIREAAKKIRKLSKNEIDEFWAKTGWKEEGKGKNKSLPDWRLEKIKNEEEFARQQLTNFFQETPKEEFIKMVEEIKSPFDSLYFNN